MEERSQVKSLAANVPVRETEIPKLMNRLSEVIMITQDEVSQLEEKLSNSILRSAAPEPTAEAKKTSLPITGLGENIHDKTSQVKKIHSVVQSILYRLEI